MYFLYIIYFLILSNVKSLLDIKKTYKVIILSNKLFIKKYHYFIKIHNDTINNYYEEINKLNVSKLIIDTSIETSSNDIMNEINSLLSYITNTNKELLYILQQSIMIYIKFLMSESIIYIKNKDYLDNEFVINNINSTNITKFVINNINPTNITKFVIKNLIIPTVLHDLFQSLSYFIKNHM